MNGDLRLMLIDGHALIHRAYHAVPGLTTSSGELTNAVFGFTNILLKELDLLKPTHVIMAMDRPTPTFRHIAFAQYKATRTKTPEPLIPQFVRVREMAAAMNIPIYEVDGFEADDVLGTLAAQAEAQNIQTMIVTGDLDALQLVSDKVHVTTPARGLSETTVYDRDAVVARYGLLPSLLPDWKALVGDNSDNIPGVFGIGKTTATDLLQKYGTLEGIYDHLEELPDKRRDEFRRSREQAFQSRELARIVRNVPIELSLTNAAHLDVDRNELLKLCTELEFRSLVPRIRTMFPEPRGGNLSIVSDASARQLSMFDDPPGSSSTTERSEPGADASLAPSTVTRIVRTHEDLQALNEELRGSDLISVDTETTSTDPLRAQLVGLSFATNAKTAWYVPVGHSEGDQLGLVEVVDALRPILEDESKRMVGHNLKYDYAVLMRHGIRLRSISYDTMIAAYLVDPSGRGLSLSSLAMARFGLEMTPIEALIGKGKNQKTMAEVDISTVAQYAGADAAVTFQLVDVLNQDLVDRGLEKLFHEVEMPLVEVLAEMEMAGTPLDIEVLSQMSAEMTETIGRLEGSIYERAGHRFNINSTQQLGQVLFNEIGLPAGRRTKTGHSTDNEVLENLRGSDPVVDYILEYRQLIKLKNTYVDALPSLINPETDRVHTDFNQCVASTGRLSSSNPNLQNIPIRGDIGRKIRRAFVGSQKGHVLLAADYSQIELRILASMSKDERLMNAFLTGEDVHRATASAVFNVPLEGVTSDQRRIAKVVNFGIIYGIGEVRLAHETGITRSEAAEFISNYNQTYSGVKAFMDRLRRTAILRGYVSTLLGRRRYLPDITSNHPGVRTAAERAAINMPIQGTAADIIKVAMIRLHHELRARFPESRMTLQVHDELVFDVPERDLRAVADLVKHVMEHAVELDVPLETEVKAGKDWYDMTPISSAA